jgi:hypothetical protein
MTKPAWRGQIRRMAAEPAKVEIRGYAEAARIVEVPGRPQIDALVDLHLWDVPLIDMRFAYRPEKPLYLVVVRAFALPSPVTIDNTLEYAGCKSWVPLREAVDISGASQVIAEEELQVIVRRIERTFGSETL